MVAAAIATPALGKGAKATGFEDLDAGIDGGLEIEKEFDKIARKKGQHRGADGKFESLGNMNDDFDMNTYGSGPYVQEHITKKKSKANKIMSLGDTKSGDLFQGPKKKGRGRPAGAGQVANLFYNSQTTQDLDVLGEDKLDDMPGGGKYLNGMEGLDSDALSR